MTQQTLMLIEATGIQDYIFGSNELLQHIGASELVQQATTDWLYETLPAPHNIDPDPKSADGWQIADRGLVADHLAAEVVYAGGGNAMVLFADDDQARAVARRLTRRILIEAPGLQIVLKRKTFDPHQEPLSALHQQLRDELAQRKLDRQRSTPLLGLGVTAACVFTGAPAVAVEDGQLISAQVQAKRNAQSDGQKRLNRHLPGVTRAGYEFVYDFNKLGTKGESSYLAVIHTDGNGMGERIKDIGRNYPTASDNAAYVLALRRFSESVQEAATAALNSTVGMLLDPANIVRDKYGQEKLGEVVPIFDNRYLPFRPIVFGGDDVTFVCEGRLGLEIAAKYLGEYSSRRLSDGKLAHARAGVAVVRSHYPFSRAYDLADALAKSAKGYIKHWEDQGEPGVTALDWHFAITGLVLPLRDVRKREFTVPAGSLLMRPLRLSNPAADWRSWQTFSRVLYEFQNSTGKWAGRRNKIKALRDALRTGQDAVRLFMRGFDHPLPDIAQQPDMQTDGWQGGYCGYFDAVEALDFYVPLKGGFKG